VGAWAFTSRSISRVLFRRRMSPAAVIYLGRQLPVASSSLPESRRAPSQRCSLFGLAPSGVYLAIQVTLNAGGLLPHRFTLTMQHAVASLPHSAVCFLLHFPGSCDRSVLPTALLCGARTFLRFCFQNQRPPDRLANAHVTRVHLTGCASISFSHWTGGCSSKVSRLPDCWRSATGPLRAFHRFRLR